MTYVFRADASPLIGSGHVVRSVAVAEALRDAGQEVIHVGKILDLPWLDELLIEGAFSQYGLDESDVPPSKENKLVIDSYSLDTKNNYFQLDSWGLVACLVDKSTPQFHANLYFNLSPEINWKPAIGDSAAKIYSGVEYIPVRKIHLFKNQKTSESVPLRIVITSGGSDSTNLIDSIINNMAALDFEFEAEVLSNNSFELDSRFKISRLGSSLSRALEECDLVLTAAGSTIWELLNRRIAFGVFCCVDNQLENYKFLSSTNLASPLGIYDMNLGWKIDDEALRRLIVNSSTRAELRSRMCQLQFGEGAKNIANILMGFSS